MHRSTRTLMALAAVLSVVCLFPTAGQAWLYAADRGCQCVYSYEDTVGTDVTPDTLSLLEPVALGLDHLGRVLVAGYPTATHYVSRFDPVTEESDRLFSQSLIADYIPLSICPDDGDDIYVLMLWDGGTEIGREDPSPDDFVAVLHGGEDPAEVAYVFASGISVIDMQVRPIGSTAGNIVVLVEDTFGGGHHFIEIERTAPDTFVYYQTIADGGMMPADPRAFSFDPFGGIVLVDFTNGLYYVDEYYGYVWGMGSAYGPGFGDMTIDANGIIYLANRNTDRIERYDSGGYPIGSPFGSNLTTLRAVTSGGYTPTPEGENVLVEPWPNIEITFEGVTASGFTSAEVETSSTWTSPEGNILPEYAYPPGSGSRANPFTYVSLSTDAVYTDLIQVDVLLEGSRMFYASGVGDTFRDFTVVGSIEDARGTIPRFSEFPAPRGRPSNTGPTEVVLVEDTRELSEVVSYKFWRLERAMAVPDTVPYCPWGAIHALREYRLDARTYYDEGNYGNALLSLAMMNTQVRNRAGWCIPNSSDDENYNLVARILAHSKSLMFSIEEVWGHRFTGLDELPSALSLAAVSPARGECRMFLNGPVGTLASVSIYDVAGRLVATVHEGSVPVGGAVVVWDGLDSTGKSAASGVYFARARAEGQSATSKIVYMK